MTIDVVPVALGARSYEVRIGAGLIARAGAEIAPLLRRPKVAVVTDDTVAAHHLMALSEALVAEGIAMTALAVPPGEGSKSWEQFARVSEWLLEQKVERRDVVAHAEGVALRLPEWVLREGVRLPHVPHAEHLVAHS